MLERAHLVAGLGFGDEGKGSVVDWLVRAHGADTVVRYNGGAQAAHRVVTTDGREHICAQFSAGTLVPGVRTFLARFVVVDLLALAAEERALATLGITDGYRRLSVDPGCVIATPFHRIVNRMRELCRGPDRHGSCGMGIGEARLDSERPGMPTVTVADTGDRQHLRARLRLLWLTKVDQAEQLVDARPDAPGLRAALDDLRRPDRVPALVDEYHGLIANSGVRVASEPTDARVAVFEGAQGVLLDRERGFWPHVTPSRTTFAHAETLLDEWGEGAARTRVGVLRAYATRHGAGPLVTEDPELGAARPDRENHTHPWQGRFRLGWFDGLLARFALALVGGVDDLVISNLDRLAGLPLVRLCGEYQAADGTLVGAIPALTEHIPASPEGRAASRRRTDWVSACRPIYREFPGWARNETRPAGLRGFIEALEGPAGCARSVTHLSFGPTAAAKCRAQRVYDHPR